MFARIVAPALSLACVLFAGCIASGPGSEAETIEVDIGPSRTLCNGGELEYGCLQTRADSTASWNNFYPHISGFTFQWGYVTRVRMTRIVDDPKVQDSIGEYVLKTVVSKTPVAAGTREVLTANSASGNPWEIMVKGSCAEGYRLYGEASLRFTTSAACAEFESKVKSTKRPSAIEIEHGAPGAPITVVSVRE